ncbi:TPA: hypothetical protein ACH3X1_002544 [Trebouxia sp. C0004]
MTLWDEVADRLPAAEVDEVKRLLCPGLIDSNQALQNELSALRDMYISLQQQVDALSDKHMLFQTTERSLIENDLSFLLSRLLAGNADQSHSGSNASQSQFRTEQVFQTYIRTKPSFESRGIRASSSSLRPASSLSAESSMRSTASDAGQLEPSALTAVRTALQEKTLNAEVQTVRAHFQAAFAEEHQGLLVEIEHMQTCLADEADLHAHAQMTPPPLTALREYNVKMRAQLQEAQEQQLHEKRIRQLSVSQESAQVSQQGDAFIASSPSLQSLASQTSATGSFSKRPDTAYEGRLAASASGLQSSAAGCIRSRCADSGTGNVGFPSASQSDTPQAVCAQNHQAGPVCSDEWVSQSCSTGTKSCQPVPPGQHPPHKRDSKVRSSPKSRQLSHHAWV